MSWIRRPAVRRRSRVRDAVLAAAAAASGLALAAMTLTPAGGGPPAAAAPSEVTSSASPAPQPAVGPAVQAGTVFPVLQRFCLPTPAASSTAAARSRSPAGGGAPAPATDFEGLSSADSQVKVPMADTSGSAGHFAFGEVINMAIGFFSKSTGRPLCAPQTTQQMWTGTACASGAFSDAVLRYDTFAHRWIVAKPASGGYCIAVSEGEDPDAGWFRYEFPVSVPGEPAGADFWKLSVWRDSYTFSTRDVVRTSLHSSGPAVYGDYVAAFQRNAMLSGQPTSAVVFLVPQTPAPADSFPSGSPDATAEPFSEHRRPYLRHHGPHDERRVLSNYFLYPGTGGPQASTAGFSTSMHHCRNVVGVLDSGVRVTPLSRPSSLASAMSSMPWAIGSEKPKPRKLSLYASAGVCW